MQNRGMLIVVAAPGSRILKGESKCICICLRQIKAKELNRYALLHRSVLKRPDFPQFFPQLWKTPSVASPGHLRMLPDFDDD